MSLQRFIDAQQGDYEIALSEINNAAESARIGCGIFFRKLMDLGFSETLKFYAIKNMDEAEEYLYHPVLGKRLIEISNALLNLNTDDARQVFGSPDDLKLKSSMTLFS